MNAASTPKPETLHDVIIVGAGPVGLLLACLLGAQGIRTLLVEQRSQPLAHSMAIGITPPSLQILQRLQLAQPLIQAGVKVRDCFIHGQSGPLGRVSFRDIDDPHRFVLSIPQAATMAMLKEKLAYFPTVKLQTGVKVQGVQQDRDRVELKCTSLETGGPSFSLNARYVVACDGSRSRLRQELAVATTGRTYPCHFVMGDFVDRSNLGDAAHLFFLANGSVESFPLPDGQRRWIVQTEEFQERAPQGLISDLVAQRTGIHLPVADQLHQSSFTPRRLNCARYDQGRILLCGDAAHVMSPIGGQGMNTGFADAEFLANALGQILQRGQPAAPLFGAYNRYRQRAAKTAIFRAGWGMWLGTWRGRFLSSLRDILMRHLLFRGPIGNHLGAFYAMLTIPYNTLQRVPASALANSTPSLL